MSDTELRELERAAAAAPDDAGAQARLRVAKLRAGSVEPVRKWVIEKVLPAAPDKRWGKATPWRPLEEVGESLERASLSSVGVFWRLLGFLPRKKGFEGFRRYVLAVRYGAGVALGIAQGPGSWTKEPRGRMRDPFAAGGRCGIGSPAVAWAELRTSRGDDTWRLIASPARDGTTVPSAPLRDRLCTWASAALQPDDPAWTPERDRVWLDFTQAEHLARELPGGMDLFRGAL